VTNIRFMCRAVPSTPFRRRRKFEDVSCTKCTDQGNDFELIPMVKMETRLPVEGHLLIHFRRSVISRKALKIIIFWGFVEKQPLTGTFWKFCSERIHRGTDGRVVFKLREIWPTGNR